MKYCLFFLSFFTPSLSMNAQCGAPPPPGANPIYSIDTDNDGYTSFDIGYYITHFERPLMEEVNGVSSAGYNFTFYNSNDQLSGLIYTNIQLEEFCTIHYEYTGTGPTFQPQPPCYWPAPTFGFVKLVAVASNQDKDGDGILNIDEDSNHNFNLMDDDDDHDGIINLDDTSNLSISPFDKIKLDIYPNPVENGIVTFKSDTPVSSVIAYNVTGKQVMSINLDSNSFIVRELGAGIYFFKFQSQTGNIFRKIVIR